MTGNTERDAFTIRIFVPDGDPEGFVPLSKLLTVIAITVAWCLAMPLGATAQTSADIKLVQQKLSAYNAGTADGQMGSKTRNAIKAYQRDWQIAETGGITTDLVVMLKREHSKTKAQWPKVSNQDCEVWAGAPQARETITWSGGCTGGKVNGTGTGKLVWASIENGQSKTSTYDGGYRDGKMHGRGVWTGTNGDKYDGQFQDGKPHGRGVFTTASGKREVRRWRKGCSTLNGSARWINTTEQACGF
jgi:hypothetical protein